ncbi:MAG: hypothetical protein V7K57_26870, partial [Nostoc sp.]
NTPFSALTCLNSPLCVDSTCSPKRYQMGSIEPNPQGLLWSQQLSLYLGVHDNQLRYFNAEGQVIPTPEEIAQWEAEHAEQERQRAEQEKQRAERLAAKLRELGVDPDTI